MKLNNLHTLRKKINSIDAQIISLLAKRQSCSREVGKFKKKNGIAIHQPKREKEILAKIEKMAKVKKIEPEFINKMYRVIFKNSREVQKGV